MVFEPIVSNADVNSPCQAYNRMLTDWQLCRDLMAGEPTMKQRGVRWLPAYEQEDPSDYRVRLENSTLFNAFRRTVLALVGRVFRDPVGLTGEPHEDIERWSQNIDLEGRSLSVFCRDWFEDAMISGLSHVLVDYSKHDEGPATREEELTDRVRPRWELVRAEDLIGWKVDYYDGQPHLSEVRIRKTVMEPDGEWGEKPVTRVKVWRPGEWLLYEFDQNQWVLTEHHPSSFTVDGEPAIPLVTCYTGRTGFLTAQPPLLGLAYLNLRHWRSQSRQNDILDIARCPVWAYFGFKRGDVENIRIGPRMAISSSDPQARAEIIEISGAGIQAGKDDLEKLEQQMSTMGLELLMQQAPNVTATGEIIAQSQNSSELAAMAGNLKDSIELALQYTARWREDIDVEDAGEVTINGNLDLSPMDSTAMSVLDAARTRGDLSRQQWTREMLRRRVLGLDFDPEKNAEEIAQEGPRL